MTRKQITKYVEKIAKELHLEDWTFTLNDGCDDDALASIQCVFGQKHANIWFSEIFWERPANYQRHVIVHELIHAHFAGEYHLLSGDYLKDQLGVPAHDAFFAGYNQQHEYGVDALARALEKHLPLPPP